MEQSLLCALNLLIESGKGEVEYYLFDINDQLIVRQMTPTMMLEKLGYFALSSQPIFGIFEKNIILDCEVFINVTKR